MATIARAITISTMFAAGPASVMAAFRGQGMTLYASGNFRAGSSGSITPAIMGMARRDQDISARMMRSSFISRTFPFSRMWLLLQRRTTFHCSGGSFVPFWGSRPAAV